MKTIPICPRTCSPPLAEGAHNSTDMYPCDCMSESVPAPSVPVHRYLLTFQSSWSSDPRSLYAFCPSPSCTCYFNLCLCLSPLALLLFSFFLQVALALCSLFLFLLRTPQEASGYFLSLTHNRNLPHNHSLQPPFPWLLTGLSCIHTHLNMEYIMTSLIHHSWPL